MNRKGFFELRNSEPPVPERVRGIWIEVDSTAIYPKNHGLSRLFLQGNHE